MTEGLLLAQQPRQRREGRGEDGAARGPLVSPALSSEVPRETIPRAQALSRCGTFPPVDKPHIPAGSASRVPSFEPGVGRGFTDLGVEWEAAGAPLPPSLPAPPLARSPAPFKTLLPGRSSPKAPLRSNAAAAAKKTCALKSSFYCLDFFAPGKRCGGEKAAALDPTGSIGGRFLSLPPHSTSLRPRCVAKGAAFFAHRRRHPPTTHPPQPA